MTPRSKTKTSYKVLTGVVILIGLLNFVFFVPYFETNEEVVREVPNLNFQDEFNRKEAEKMPQLHQEGSNYSDFIYNSLTWPREKSEKIFHTLFNDHHFWWIYERVQSLWPEFEWHASKIKEGCTESSKKKILILPGVLVFTNFAEREVVKRGGSLGELTQWADLIAGSLALCHSVNVKTNFKEVDAHLKKLSENKGSSSGCSSKEIDLIFTDIIGIKHLSPEVAKYFKKKFRILDVFGTEAAFNDPEYAETNHIDNQGWGGLGLHLKQFCTMFPHTPDNSFLGFVVSSSNLRYRQKQNYSLILGKEAFYLKGKMELLKAIHEFFPIAVTMHQRSVSLLPEDALVLGVLNPSEYALLLSEAKVCVGLGDPIESPSPLLSLAAGCIFLNPTKNSTLNGKPTHRRITSQHAYLERYIKQPHVFTYDMNDLDQLRTILETIRTIERVDPIIPKPFTVGGFLRRLESTILSRDFCDPRDLHQLSGLPPLRTFLSRDSKDCKDLCYRRGLVCEPDYFAKINNLTFLTRLGLKCQKVSRARDLHVPAYNAEELECHLQPSDDPVFSCVGRSAPGNLRRICPCTTDDLGEMVGSPETFRKSTYLTAFARP